MSDTLNEPELKWRDDGVPVASRFDDPYYSLSDGAAESRYVFFDGNQLAERLCDGFHVAELGFGTGLNLSVLLEGWRKTERSGSITFTSFELFPLPQAQAAKALSAFPDLTRSNADVLEGFAASPFALHRSDIDAHVILGDAREMVRRWSGCADAWFLDGFSPAKNPELWEKGLLQAVFDHTRPGGTLATYSAAGQVRRDLEKAGFIVERVKGFKHKRHMTIAKKP